MGDSGEGRIRLSFQFKTLARYAHNMGLTTVAADEFRPDGKGRLLLKAGYSGFMSFKSTKQFGFGGVIDSNVSLSLRFNLQAGEQYTSACFVRFARLETRSPSLNQVFAGCFCIDL
jgi:hypothetical protein